MEKAVGLDQSWPYVRRRVNAPFVAWLARLIFFLSVRRLDLAVELPDGRLWGKGTARAEPGGVPTMRVVDPGEFFSRLALHGSLGFGEAYLSGAWTVGSEGADPADRSDELVEWLRVYATALQRRERRIPRLMRHVWLGFRPTSEKNTIDGAKRNVQAHYDLTSELFSSFLDSSMTYSCGWFEESDDLAAAQQRKVDGILDIARVSPGTRLLDVGSGFGELVIRAATRRHAMATGITISDAQWAYSTGRAHEAGLDESRARFLIEDYREHVGTYDAIASVEMIEAVGPTYWLDFFKATDQLLIDGGHLGLQVITFPHQRMKLSMRNYSWVDRYIFPGGALPSLREIDRIVTEHTALRPVFARSLRESYARTLREWRLRFIASSDRVRALGFDDVFLRLWVLYFAYFEAGFRCGYCDVWQLGFRKEAQDSHQAARPPG